MASPISGVTSRHFAFLPLEKDKNVQIVRVRETLKLKLTGSGSDVVSSSMNSFVFFDGCSHRGGGLETVAVAVLVVAILLVVVGIFAFISASVFATTALGFV